MDARFYNSEEIDIERLASDLVNAFLAQGYQAQQIGNRDQMMVQLKKGGDFEAIIGMQAALSLTIQRTAGGVLAMIGQQRWIDKAAVGAVGIVALPVLWPLALTAGVGALRQASLGNQVLNMLDGLVRQQRPGIQAGPIPYQLLPQVQQQWAPPGSTPVYIPPSQAPQALPAPAPVGGKLRCPNCNTPYEPGDTFCTGCGRSLAPSRQYCSNCHFELKPGASFCPKCGASTYQPSTPAAQPASQTPVYTPPAPPAQPQTPVYIPPAQPAARPAEPYYTPPAQPAKPETPVYTPPPKPPASQPAASAQPTARPAETYYTPPTPQTPPVQPQPKVTIVPGTTQRQPPPPPKPRPQKQYYIPSSQAQQSQQGQQGQGQEQSPETQPTATYYTPPAQSPTLANQPTVAASPQSQTPWGSLVFSDGTQISLAGEHAVVGRADHDIGGLQPDVDLSKMPGADTVSRIHAAFEHTGSSYKLTDLNSTNATRVNGKRLEPDKEMPINDGDTLQFGKIVCTFKKA